MEKNLWLVAGGVLSAGASILHVAIIVGGPDWYRFFGAGERMARMAEQGRLEPALTALAIAGLLAVWAAYAFAGAGLLPRLPFMRISLVGISVIYLARGLVIFPMLAIMPESINAFITA